MTRIPRNWHLVTGTRHHELPSWQQTHLSAVSLWPVWVSPSSFTTSGDVQRFTRKEAGQALWPRLPARKETVVGGAPAAAALRCPREAPPSRRKVACDCGSPSVTFPVAATEGNPEPQTQGRDPPFAEKQAGQKVCISHLWAEGTGLPSGPGPPPSQGSFGSDGDQPSGQTAVTELFLFCPGLWTGEWSRDVL